MGPSLLPLRSSGTRIDGIVHPPAVDTDVACAAAAADGADLQLARSAERAVSLRVLPVLLMVVIISFIDRTK